MTYSIALSEAMSNEESSFGYTEGFSQEHAGRRAECEGGAGIRDTKYAGRQFFCGTLTGHYRDFGGQQFGQHTWRWYLLAELRVKPDGFPHDAVWCEEESLTLFGRE